MAGLVSGGSHQEVILNLSTLMLYLNLSLTDKKKYSIIIETLKKKPIVKEIILKVLR